MPPSTTGPLDVRRAGVLLHPTSLPSAYGAGDIGPWAYRFVDFLQAAGCTLWQVLPLVPTHPGDGSPYNAISAMAGNPELVSLDRLAEWGLLTDDELTAVAAGRLGRPEARTSAARRFTQADDPEADDPGADDPQGTRHQGNGLPRSSDRRGDGSGSRAEFRAWCANQEWLEDYARFVVLRRSLADAAWAEWPAPLRDRDPAAMKEALAPLEEELDVVRVEQWFFSRQWAELHRYAADRGVLVFGDLPIFVSYDSADVWNARDMFLLDDEGRPTTVTGVPPDYFSEDGQRWNNPHYDWEAMAQDGYTWWRRRVARQRELFDVVRIDHFRGFEASWHVPAGAETAKEGTWVQTPGSEVLAALVDASGPGTLVAEDLGTITTEVTALRLRFGLPGMVVLHFAFDGDDDNMYLPEHHEPLSVVYTGTHDNDTTVGWWSALPEEGRKQVAQRLEVHDEPMPWALIRMALASVGRLAVVPAQDLLALGSESRMNTPGTASGNWSWQSEPGDFDRSLAARLRALVERYDRVGTVRTGPVAS
jgi:4-alpha-glucanotransferase